MRTRGFTLVELLVGLAVAAILLTIAIPGYAFLVSTSRLAAVTNDLMTALHLARSEAITHGVRVTVCKTGGSSASCSATGDWTLGWMVFVDGGTQGVVDGDDVLLQSSAGGSSAVSVVGNNYSRYISYLPTGASRSTNGLPNGSFAICAGNAGRDIVINAAGRARLAPPGNC